MTFTPGKRLAVAQAPRGSTTVTSNSSWVAIGASDCAICTAPTMISRGGGTYTFRKIFWPPISTVSLRPTSMARRAAETIAASPASGPFAVSR
jgi:hypothetical protein